MTLGINVMEESINIPIPLYIDDNGVEQAIDLDVRPSVNTSYRYENTTNSIKAYFKENICDYSPIKVVTDKGFFDWTPFGVGFQDEHENEIWLGRVNDIVAEVVDSNKVIYRNCVSGIDEEFVVDYGKLKHNTILNGLPIYDNSLAGKDISFVVDGKMDFSSTISMFVDDQIQTGDFTTDGSIVFKNDNDETVFTLPEPITYEINGNERIKCRYKVKRQGSVISLKIIVPYEWLENPARIYPIAIDPTLEVVITSDVLTRITRATFSNNGEYFAISTYTDTRMRLFKVNHQLKRINEMPLSVKRYPGRAEYCVGFSPDDQYIVYGGYSTFNIYKFNPSTQDYDIQTNTSSNYVMGINFSDDGEYLFAGNSYALNSYKFDSKTGTIASLSNIATAYLPHTMKLTKNGKFLFCLQSSLTDATTLLTQVSVNNGVIGSPIPFPSGTVDFNNILDFDLTDDERFIVFGYKVAPYIHVCPYNSGTGVIGAPLQMNISILAEPVRRVALSKHEQYLVINQTGSTQTRPYFSVYKFNKFTGIVGNLWYTCDRTTVARSMSLGFSNDGEYFYFTQDISTASQSLWIYKFFHEPYDNVYFKDPATDDYYSDNKGNTRLLIDFGNMIAGTNSLPKKVLLENNNDFAVKDILLVNDNNDPNFNVVLSKTETPFVPEKDLDFGTVTLNPNESVEFYIQITTTDQSQAGGMFELTVKFNEA